MPGKIVRLLIALSFALFPSFNVTAVEKPLSPAQISPPPGSTPSPDAPDTERAGDAPVLTLPAPASPPAPHTIYLRSRQFQPGRPQADALQTLLAPGRGRVHLLVQLDFIPRQAARDELAAKGLRLLAYVPDYAWIASTELGDAASLLSLPGVAWAGSLEREDKLAPEILAGQWGAFNLSAEGRAAVYVVLHKDEGLAKGRQLVADYGGTVTGEVIGLNLLVVEMPLAQVTALAGEDAVQWIEPAAPPLEGISLLHPRHLANDGIRAQTGVNTVQASPYSLSGAGVDALVYDVGQVGDHPDLSGRLVHGDAASVADHSSHVAGTLAGNGSQSALAGGSAQQWRGMAPQARVISYATNISSLTPIAFYENPGDIEADWAAAQNTHGADLGTASLGMNIYANYPGPGYCYLFGAYGATDVLLDQIVRGGNPVVGIGDRYIATWAAGNERPVNNCSFTDYHSVASPATSKNPIQVGAVNTNDNSMTFFSSWGPTDDGRIKPIVVAGGAQVGGDNGIKSTIPDVYINIRSLDCDGSGDDYCYPYDKMSGTSMATPAVAGGIALMLQQYRAIYDTSGNFWPSTAKAILMQTSTDLGASGPDYQNGYGLVNFLAAVDLISRRAFIQSSLSQGDVKIYTLVVPRSDRPLQISLAWDDFEATFNAANTLINDLDLELVAPSGALWRPWVLDPANPANPATRNVDHRNNQEQVMVASPEVGTWLVRVRGTTVPQSPQSFSLACEGCKPLNLGACQNQLSGVALGNQTSRDTSDEPGGETLASDFSFEPLSPGEVWQRSLEAEKGGDTPPTPSLAVVEEARRLSPDAAVTLLNSLTGEARDLAWGELQAAEERLAAESPPPEPQIPLTEAQEESLLAAQEAVEAALRAQGLSSFTDANESQSQPIEAGQIVPQFGDAPLADLTVGNGCAYATIQAAVDAANPGDRLLVEGGRTFNERVHVNKNLTIQGGYMGCASGSSDRTTVNGGGGGSVFTIDRGLNVTMLNLNITGGNSGFEGGGIVFAWGSSAVASTLTLANMDVYNNTAAWGGGVWVGLNADLNANNVILRSNTASAYGGGLRLFGSRATFANSNIYNNQAPVGGGVYASREVDVSPSLSLPQSADVYSNNALSGDGLGGGIYLRQGSLSLDSCSDLYQNRAIQGGGAYLITSTLTIHGDCSEIDHNEANQNGGGLLAVDSTILLQEDAELSNNLAGVDGSGSGGGAYLDHSTFTAEKSVVMNNQADDFGGGIYASDNSSVAMRLGGYTCQAARCSRLVTNTAISYYGGGIYATYSSVSLENTFIENNTANYGGGLYASYSTVTANSSLFARNNAKGGIGHGIRLYNGSSFTGLGNTLAYNADGGAATGRAIDLSSATLNLGCSLIWGHSSGINLAGQAVTYSDVQGGYVGEGNLDLDPLFVNPSGQDYHLQSASPIIDRCLSGPSRDFDDQARPIVRSSAASPYDMGADEVAGFARVGVDGACAYSTIQQAVNAAGNGATLRVASGVYFENVDLVGKNLTIQGGYDAACSTPSSGTTRVEGSLGSGSVFDINGGVVTLRDLHIAWGGDTGGGLDIFGGAQVALEGVKVYNNHALSGYGGGVWVDNNSSLSANLNTDIYNNTATYSGGGGRIWGRFTGLETLSDFYGNCAADGGGVSLPGGRMNLIGSDVYSNLAASSTGKGGGIYIDSGGVITLTQTVWLFSANTAYDGGGIYASQGVINLPDRTTVVRDNTARRHGAGIYLANSSSLQAEGVNIYANVADSDSSHDGYGGGVYNDNSQLNLDHSYMFNNQAEKGGAVFQAGASSSMHIYNSLIDQNVSIQAYGAGFRVEAGSSELRHVTIADNSGGAGFSQLAGLSSQVFNSIAWGNTHGGFLNFASYGCNIDQSNSAGIPVNPLFVGGGNYRLQLASPAVEACLSGLPLDLDGNPRPSGVKYDMGAYEYQFNMLRLPLVIK